MNKLEIAGVVALVAVVVWWRLDNLLRAFRQQRGPKSSTQPSPRNSH